MPRVSGFTDLQRIENQCTSLSTKVDHLRMDNKITYSRIADTLGISPQAVSQQFRRRNISMEVALTVFYLTGADPEKIGQMMKVKG